MFGLHWLPFSMVCMLCIYCHNLAYWPALTVALYGLCLLCYYCRNLAPRPAFSVALYGLYVLFNCSNHLAYRLISILHFQSHCCSFNVLGLACFRRTAVHCTIVKISTYSVYVHIGFQYNCVLFCDIVCNCASCTDTFPRGYVRAGAHLVGAPVATEECGPTVYICCAKLPLGFLHPVGIRVISHTHTHSYSRSPDLTESAVGCGWVRFGDPWEKKLLGCLVVSLSKDSESCGWLRPNL